MKLGFFGGSFDPIHHGHLIAAQDAREQLGLDRVIFIPSFHSPLKGAEPRIPPEDRAALLRLAIDGIPGFEVSTLEIERGGISYTVETVTELRRRHPGDRLYWILGQDQVARLPRWRRIRELAERIEFASLRRPGAADPGCPDVPGLVVHPVASHTCDISSTEIRARVRAGRSIHFLTPRSVVSRILEKKWYTGNLPASRDC